MSRRREIYAGRDEPDHQELVPAGQDQYILYIQSLSDFKKLKQKLHDMYLGEEKVVDI